MPPTETPPRKLNREQRRKLLYDSATKKKVKMIKKALDVAKQVKDKKDKEIVDAFSGDENGELKSE